MVNDFKIAENEEALFNQSLCGILYLAADGTIIKINHALLHWLNDGSTPLADASSFIKILSPHSVYWYYSICLSALRSQEKVNATQINLLKSDGNYLPVVIEAVALLNDAGKPYFRLVIIQANPLPTDLTGNKLLLNKPAFNIQSDNWFQATFTHSPIPQVVTDLNTGNVAMVNEAMLSLSGATAAAEFIGKPAADFYSNPQARLAIITELIEKGESLNKETIFFYKDKELTFLTSSRLVKLNEVQMILTFFVNITPQKKNEEEARLILEQRNMVLSNITDGFCLVNHQWEVTYWNAEAATMLQIPQDAIMGGNISAVFKELRDTHTVLHVESYFAPLNLWLLVSAYPSVIGLSIYFRDITDKKQAAKEITLLHETLAAERKLLRTIIDYLPINVFVNDAQANKILVNKAEYEFLGATSEAEVLAGNQLEFFDEASIKIFLEHSRQVMQSGIPLINKETTLFKIDGSKTCFLVTKIPMYNDEGEGIGMVGISFDITERKKMEDELKNSHQQLFLAHKAAKLGHWTYNMKKDFYAFSPEMYKVLDIDPQNFTHTLKGFMQLVHPDDVSILVENRRKAFKYKADFNADHRIFLRDGSIKWINVQALVEWNEQDEPIMIIGISQDITDRKQKEAEIKQLNEKLELKVKQRTSDLQRTQAMLYEAQRIAKVGSWEFNLITNEVKWSPEMFIIAGFEPADTPPTTIERQQKYPAADWDKLQHALQISIEKGTPFELEVAIFRENNTLGFLIAKGQPVLNQQGKAKTLIGTVADITQQKQTEFYLEKSRQELEAFSYSVSHDLRAPLRGIDGWSLALLEDYGELLDDTGKKYIASVREESQRMGHLIDDLLKLSQINKKQLKRTKVLLSLLAKNIAERLAESNKVRKIEFVIQPDLIVYGDARLIEIVLNNLFENAVKFTAKEPVATIQFGITIINNTAAYFIKDNGVGFSMQAADKLFGAFQRLHNKSDFEGTGIGLATVQRIINLHNGKVWANAVAGEGATFYFLF